MQPQSKFWQFPAFVRSYPADYAPSIAKAHLEAKFMQKIKDLGAKLKVLEGVIGFSCPIIWFANQFLAERLGIGEDQMSRRKTGGTPVSNQELSKLIELYRLGPELDYQIFLIDTVEDFRQKLRDAKVGTYGLDGTVRVRQQLVSDSNRKTSGITIERIAMRGDYGGLGLHDDNTRRHTRLWVRDQARITVETPGSGHLLVFSDSLRGEVVALMPSCFASQCNIETKIITIPSRSSPRPALDVSAPGGWYRLFAIWTPRRITIPRFEMDMAEVPPLNLLSEEFRIIENALAELREQGLSYEIRIADYFVAE